MLNVNLLWERARIVPVGPILMRVVKELGRAARSRTFMFIVSVPFSSWSLLLMWGHSRFSDEVMMRAVAAGPGVVLQLWAAAVTIWFMVAFAFGRYRHSLAVGIGYFAVLVLLALQTPPARDAIRARAAPWMQQPPQAPASKVR
jgi:CDP-diglyceride synthetase